jgi:hypothetical protein
VDRADFSVVVNFLRMSKLACVANEPLKKMVLKWGRNLLDLGLAVEDFPHFDAE